MLRTEAVTALEPTASDILLALGTFLALALSRHPRKP